MKTLTTSTQLLKKTAQAKSTLIPLLGLGLLALAPSRAHAALQQVATPFETFKSQLDLSQAEGSTYLTFMLEQVKPRLDSYEQAVTLAEQGGNYRAGVMELLSSGQGAAIRIDASNYILNVGYLTGENQDDVKSGRSFGVGPTGRQSDPSDLFYLGELESYLSAEPNPEAFYRALLGVLTDCDSSGWTGLSSEGQTVATDFLAIYTAESDRHIMVHLQPSAHPWENDLAGATFVSALDVATGLMLKNQKVVEGQITDWWAKGKVGSGIGETRADRLELQRNISAYERTAHPELVAAIESITGASTSGDVIQQMLEYLNNSSTPSRLGAEAPELTEAFVKFLMQARADAAQIMTN